jgi:hypothetical protein
MPKPSLSDSSANGQRVVSFTQIKYLASRCAEIAGAHALDALVRYPRSTYSLTLHPQQTLQHGHPSSICSFALFLILVVEYTSYSVTYETSLVPFLAMLQYCVVEIPGIFTHNRHQRRYRRRIASGASVWIVHFIQKRTIY